MTTNREIAATLAKFDISTDDLGLVREVGRLLGADADKFVDELTAWIRQQDEFTVFFKGNQRLIERVDDAQRRHWHTFLAARIDEAYFTSRRHIGAVHEHIQLPNEIYCATMSMAQQLLFKYVQAIRPVPDKVNAMVTAVIKLSNLDTYLSLDEISRIQREKILAHSQSIMEMSTPVTPIWEGILLPPLLGIVDSSRTHDIMNKTLSKISETRARAFVMDISGVMTVDTAVANQIIKITKATQLMGCESIISGISPAIARTIVELGINIGEVKTTATLRDAFEIALRLVGAEPKASKLDVRA
jgi:rsbT co-antagonist protein RsbR